MARSRPRTGSGSRAARKLRDLAARARAATDTNDLERAVQSYEALEAADSANPEWPRELAQLHRRAGQGGDELDALVRCADRHAERGEFLPALATYKTVLATDPGHLLAQQRLSNLQPDSGSVAVQYIDPPRSQEFTESAIAPSAPLDELVLTQIIEGACPASLTDGGSEGVQEIPIETVPPESPESEMEDLERVPLFSSLDRQSLDRLLQRVEVVELRAGEELFHQGDPGASLYVVAQGAVVPIAEGETRTRLAVLEQGEFFGEIALFTNQPRNATVEALVDCQLLRVDRSVMWKLVQEHSQVLSILLQFLRERLIQRLVRTSPLFKIFSSGKRAAIAQRFRFLEVSDGHTVIDQHRPAEALFILLSGQMEVIHGDESPADDDKVLATLAPGELFGEMSLLWREPSLASVVARGKCWLLALPAADFREMLDHHPQLAALAANIASERREQNKRTLRDALGHRAGKAGII